jgi:multidrug efflux pump subunit AcrA (membrane-fusion protein)
MKLCYRKNLHTGLFILVGVFLLSGCGGCKGKVEEQVIPVKVIKMRLDTLRDTLDYVGDIEAQDQAIVYPKVGGKIIEKVKEEGSFIKKDEVIAYIDRDEVGFEFEKSPVESPLSGLVGRIYVDKGTAVIPQTPVALVVDMDNVKVKLNIPEKFLPQVKLKQKAQVRVDAYANKNFEGQVANISPVVDLDTRTFPVEIVIPNEEHLLNPGMFARVNLVINERKSVPVILKEALLGKEPNTYVYVINGSSAHKRNIKLGIRQGAYFEVTGGLKEGELVVILGQQRLYDGVNVSVKREER